MALDWRSFISRPHIAKLPMNEQLRLFNIERARIYNQRRQQQFLIKEQLANYSEPAVSSGAAGDEGPSSQSFLLDDYPGAFFAGSLRLLRSDYTGAAIRVRRDNDNAEADIGFSGNSLDEDALLAHVGSNNGFVTTWYNQSDYIDRTYKQNTATLQPQIVTSGVVNKQNGFPYLHFNNSYFFLYNESNSIIFFNPLPPFIAFGVQTRYDDTKQLVHIGRNNWSNAPRLYGVEPNDGLQAFWVDQIDSSQGNGILSGTYDVASTDMSVIAGYQGQLTRPSGNYDSNALYLNDTLKDTTPSPNDSIRVNSTGPLGRYVNGGSYGYYFESIFYHDLLNNTNYPSNSYPTVDDFEGMRNNINNHYSIY